MTEVYEAISDQGMAVCCPFANKQWDALDKTCWRQGQSKYEDDALDLLCVPVLEICLRASYNMCIFFSSKSKVPVKSKLLHRNIVGSSAHSCILLTVHLVLFYSLFYITWCLLLCGCTESCLGQRDDVNCTARWPSHL